MTPTTPRQAREAAELYRDTGTTVRVAMVFSLADQVEALTKERDEYQQAADTQAMAHKVELDARDVRIGALIVERSDAFFKVTQERDALATAAKLALEALNMSNTYVNGEGSDAEIDQAYDAITALKKAGVAV